MQFRHMVLATQFVLGVVYLLSGLNWFFGFMPIPSIHMPADAPIKHAVVQEMIRTGWMFQFGKVAEIAVGLSLLTNRGVPLLLALTAPLAFITFMLDALIFDDIWGWITGTVTTTSLMHVIGDMFIGGLCLLLAHVWLMFAYFKYYSPMLVWKPDCAILQPSEQASPRLHWNVRKAFLTLGWIALALQSWNMILFIQLVGKTY